MGGRGTFADGKTVQYQYKTVGYVEGIKVLEPINPKASKKLPEESHSSQAYREETMRKTNSSCQLQKKFGIDKLLNYNIKHLLNQSILNQYQLPIHFCNTSLFPDFLALNTEPRNFHLTKATGLAFYSYDYTFDNMNGLYNAIYYNNTKRLQYFKKRYAGIPFVIAPDYSIFDDVWNFENESRLFKIRILMLWFVLEMKSIVIPNAIYVAPEKMPLYYSGLENCTSICFSTKGHIRRAERRSRVKAAVRFVTDHLRIKTILVYSVCGDDNKTLRLFRYAAEAGIKIIIIDNTLRRRNQTLMKKEVIHE